EPYMALWRRCLFVLYAITSYIYRWVITFVILWFLYNWLKPYKLGVLSGMLAMAALGSMIGWPLYRLGKNIHRRGRLPDMKPIRVTVTCSIFAALILAAFTIPLPVSRVHADGVVQLQPGVSWAPVPGSLSDNGRAVVAALYVKDGERVREGDRLARFYNRDLETDLRTAEKERDAYASKLALLKTADINRNAVQEEITRT